MKIKRRQFIQTLGVGSVGGFCAKKVQGMIHENSRRPPNIIIILADDLGYGDLSCYGNTKIHTPHLDALAAGGVRFTDFHSSCSVCSPTRAGLMTGKYQQRVGIPGVLTVARHRKEGLSPDEITIPRVFHEAGYKTAMYGKWHLGYLPKFNPVQHGFDDFRGYLSGNVDYISHIDQAGVYDWWHNLESVKEEGYTTHLITKHAVQFIEENHDQPFCLYVAHEAPHYPYQGPEDPADRTVGGDFPNHGSRKDVENAYKTMVEEMDKGVGEILQKIRELDLEEDTFIFFFSDNGATKAGSNGKLRGYKGSLWEGGHRVPAIAYWPGVIPPGQICGEPAISLDIFPTILSAAKVQSPPNLKLDGVDLFPHLQKEKPIPERTLFWAFRNQKAVRKGDWKLVVTQTQKEEQIELFHLDQDISEKNNLVNEERELTDSLLKLLRSYSYELQCK